MNIAEIVDVLDCLEKRVDGWAQNEDFSREAKLEYKRGANAINEAIALLKAYPGDQPNEPLALEELREMERQPVWVETPGVDREISGRWVIVECVDIERKILYTVGDFTCHDYGTVWVAYRRPPKEKCGTCSHFIGLGDFSLCCKIHQELYYEETPACKDYKKKLPPVQVRSWEELDGLVSDDGKYKIEVDLKGECGYVRPTFKVDDPETDYHVHNMYLSTHTFYRKSGESIREKIKQFGFNIEIIPWDET